jgi:hypothetical protein
MTSEHRISGFLEESFLKILQTANAAFRFFLLALLMILAPTHAVASAHLYEGLFLDQRAEPAEWVQALAERNFAIKVKTTGFPNLKRIKQAIDEQGDYFPVSASDLREEFTLGLRAPEQLRAYILADGFKNQHQLKARGSENLKAMVETESGILGLTEEEYAHFPDEAKALYAALVRKPEPLHSRNRNLDRYGDDLWLTDDQVINRSTWTITDSWALKNDFTGKSWDHRPKSFEERDWTHLALPTSALVMTTAYLNTDGSIHFPLKQGGSYRDPFFRGWIKPPASTSSTNFLEFQIWGGLKPTQLRNFIFYKTPPSAIDLQRLRELHIRVWDGRNDGSLILYQGDS